MLMIILKYLRKNNYVNNWKEFKENYYSHPNYPSLFALTDTLSLLGIENIAVQVPKDQLEKLPENFLADILSNKSKEIVLVNRQNHNIQYETEDGKKHQSSIDSFKNSWGGLVVAIEKNETPVRKSGLLHKNTEFYLFLAITSLVFLFSFFATGIGSSLLFFKIISFLGLIISFLILQEKYEEESDGFVSKICNLKTNASCDSVIKSDKGILKWVDFSDLPILFFSTSFMALCLTGRYMPLISSISMLAIPVIAYSVYLQRVKLKKWCVLCLAVSALILIQATYFIFYFPVFSFYIENIIQYTTITMVIGSIWYFFRSLLEDRKNIREKNKSLFRFKRNFNVFNFLLKEVNDADKLDDLQPITLGNKKSPIALSLFLSPSCGHCHTAYKEAVDFMSKYPAKIKVQIYYNLNPDNLENPFLQVAKTISHISRFSNDAIAALDDWHIKQMNLEKWLEKWRQKEISDSINVIMQEQYQWCQQNGFNFTPVKIIDGRTFSTEYEIEELKYFFSDLLEQKNRDRQIFQMR